MNYKEVIELSKKLDWIKTETTVITSLAGNHAHDLLCGYSSNFIFIKCSCKSSVYISEKSRYTFQICTNHQVKFFLLGYYVFFLKFKILHVYILIGYSMVTLTPYSLILTLGNEILRQVIQIKNEILRFTKTSFPGCPEHKNSLFCYHN